MEEELKLIKKHYGEDMMHFCRDMFPTILEKNGKLLELLEANFYHNKDLYKDLVTNKMIDIFKDMIYEDAGLDYCENASKESVKELLNKAGYDLYECKTEEDIQSFKKYYKKNEELCTFRGGRLNSCYVFFAVKKNINEIKRESFKNPERQDEYGTSVISIQFTRGEINTVSIKNRYNHTVSNPDATFSNNLDNIIPGLTNAFAKEYGFKIDCHNTYFFGLDHYTRDNKGRFIKYIQEIDNIYYCVDNIILDHFIPKYDFSQKERYLFMNHLIIDLKKKEFVYYDYTLSDGFEEMVGKIKNIYVVKKKEYKEITIINNKDEKTIVLLDKIGQIISVKNDDVEKIGNEFLYYVCSVEEVSFENVREVGLYFMEYNTNLKLLNMPNVEEINDDFLLCNEKLTELYLPKVKKITHSFLETNKLINKIYMPNIVKVGDGFLKNNECLKEISLPLLEYAGNGFLQENKILLNCTLEKLKEVGSYFLEENEELTQISLPILRGLGRNFLRHNKKISYIYLPFLNNIDDNFMQDATIKRIDLPHVHKIFDNFMYNNEFLEEINAPSLFYIGNNFLYTNKCLKKIDLPKLESVDHGFLFNNKVICSVNFPLLLKVGDDFLYSNTELLELDLPSLLQVESNFMFNNKKLKYLNTPNLVRMSLYFLYSNLDLEYANIPKIKRLSNLGFLPNNNSLREVNFDSLMYPGTDFLIANNVVERIYAPNVILEPEYPMSPPSYTDAVNNALKSNKKELSLKLKQRD